MRILTIIILFISTNILAQTSYKSTLQELDKKILDRKNYYHNREQRINSLHNLLKDTKNKNNVFTIYKALNKEYLPYNIDSALFYSSKCLRIANSLNDKSPIIDAKILQAKSLVLLGLYEESKDILSTIDPTEITKNELINYYVVQISLNRFKSVYLPKTSFLPNYDSIRASYQDLLLKIIDKDSPKYKVTLADRKKDNGEYYQMRDIMLESISELDITNRAYGYTAYTLADSYGLLGDENSKIKYLALSSISDIVGGVRENAALRELALLLLNKGDIAHSNQYIQLAFDDAIFSNAKLRSYEVLQILPLINSKYEETRNRMSKNKTIFGTILAVFAIFLIVAIYYILKQKMKLQDALENNRVANERLFELNNHLEENNKKMASYNHSLELLNKGKEDYIAHYLKLSSSYIRKIDEYRKMLYKKAKKDKEELIKTLRSNEFVNNELKTFYKDFDKSFIELYPNFVNDFNLLLKEDKQIILKSSEILNTELRIFALIRLGITDSTQIARFLGYSVTTIYNYRTKTRNSSLYSKTEFLKKVESIGN
jgi:uncharacterized membrane protein